MDSFSPASPAERLDLLEERVRRSQNAVHALQAIVLLLLLAAVLIPFGLYEADILKVDAGTLRVEGLGISDVATMAKAKEFGLINRAGDRPLLMHTDKFGLPNIILMDKDKNYRLGLTLWPNSKGEAIPTLVYFDRSGMRMNLQLQDDGTAAFNLMGAEKKGGIALAVSRDGTPSMRMTDKAGKILFEAPTARP
jgi:hypothetical protein